MPNRETNAKDAAVAEQGGHVALEKTSSKKSAPKARKNAKSVKPKTKAGTKRAVHHQRKTAALQTGGKGARILEMVGRAKGATLAEIMKATDWQAHSVRGFLSTASRKRHVQIESSKSEAGDRTYRIVK
jgi:hypothetical protein